MRRTTFTVAMVMALLASFAVPAIATPPEEAVYLSVGTSLAAGSLADSGGNTTFSSDVSYTDQLHQRLKGRVAQELRHVKLGCAGETTDQFLGGVNLYGLPSACATAYETGSQMGDALATIAAGDVALITIDIGANDIIQAQQACAGDAGCIVGSIPTIAGKVAQIVGTFRATGYDGPIVAMNYYNPQAAIAVGFYPGVAGQQAPNLVLAGQSDALARGFNGALAQAYGAFDVRVADVYTAFNAGDFGDDVPENGTPDNVDVLCSLSYMCPTGDNVKPNIHLTKQGYGVVAKTLLTEVVTFDFDK